MHLLLAAVIYFALAVVSLRFSFDSSNATPIWPPSGFAFGLFLLGGRSLWPGIFVGAFAANLFIFVNNGAAVPLVAATMSLFIAAGNTLEAMTGYYVMGRFKASTHNASLFRRVPSVLLFVLAALMMCITSSTIGTVTILTGGIIPASESLHVWFTWWTGDVAGIVLITPILVVFFSGKWHSGYRLTVLKVLEASAISIAVIVSSCISFTHLLPGNFIFTRSFIILPFLILAAIQLEQKLVLFLVIATAAIAVWGTSVGIGPFVTSSLNDSLLTVELFVATNSVLVLLLHAAILERKRKVRALRSEKDDLEIMVGQRTQELARRNELLQRTNSELAVFSYAVSHDLQEPLRKIEFFSNRIIELETNLSTESKESLRKIRSTTARMKQLIENLLSYSMVEGNKKPREDTDLNLVLAEVKSDLAEAIEKSGAIIESSPLPKLKVVPFQVYQLFTNVIRNSLKFRRKDVQPQIVIRCEKLHGSSVSVRDGKPDQEGSYYHISIRDNGIGFEQEYASTIFDILQKLHGQSEYEGTGIGLAICKKVVENHQGLIKAEGEPGKGCTIHIYLPAQESHEATSNVKGKLHELS